MTKSSLCDLTWSMFWDDIARHYNYTMVNPQEIIYHDILPSLDKKSGVVKRRTVKIKVRKNFLYVRCEKK